MRRLFALVVLLVLLGVGLYYWKYQPTRASPKQALDSVGEKLRGAKTTAEVKAALELNRNLKPYPIDVHTAGDGVVTLKGEVPREDFKAEAGRVVAAVPGVRDVHNEIRIDPALPPPAEGRTLGENFDDKALEAKVKLAFSLNKGLDGTHLSVRAYRREVTVGGTVETPEQHQLALKLAGETSDVMKVSDEIQLRGQGAGPVAAASPATPAAVPGDRAKAAKRALTANPRLAAYDIQVREEGGRLVLSGRVKTAAEKDLAGLVARDATGVPIDNALEVRL